MGTGQQLAVHRKVHLFDIDIPGKIRFQASNTSSLILLLYVI
jgi:hypothetical protein